MFTKIVIYIILLVVPITANSQTENIKGTNHNNQLPSEFNLNIPSLRNYIYDRLPSYYKKGKYERMTYRFADYQSNSISNLVSSGYIYSDWLQFENYLNQILQKVLPKELENDTIIHAYIVEKGSYNASTGGSGHIFFNVGLFGYVYDEATIAAVMAHELAHYYKLHSLKSFIKQEKGHFNIDFLDIGKKRREQFSVKMEMEADSLAMEWLQNSGYHIKGLLNSYRIIERLEKQQIRRSKYKTEIKSTTHPVSKVRLQNFQQFFEKFKDDPGELFLVNENKFHLFKEQSKPEILKSLLYDFRYNECIETAFKFHLHDPDNSTYIYYLMEAIRRKCYLDVEQWGKLFYTENYYMKYPTSSNDIKKEKINYHLFKKFDSEIMGFGPEDINKIKAKFYWKELPRFETNEQAYNFFYLLAEILDCKECIFSNALSQINNKPVRDSLLNIYLKKDSVQYRVFAQDLLNDSVRKKLGNKKLLVFNNINGYIRQGQEKVPIRFRDDKDTLALLALYDSVSTSFPNRIPLYLTGLKFNKLNTYKLLNELESFSMFRTKSKGNRAKMHILDPRFIKLFYEYDVNEIEFVNCLYGEYRKGENNLEEYIKAMEMDYSTLFSQTKRTRYFEVFISSVREIENSVIKARHYGGEVSLKFKDPCFEQIEFELKNKIHLKEKAIKEIDLDYK
ncbi:MAG: M48 family metallopeptidase [Vicingus serpentipes]|nr:M48 family metallopeptidase [Vicingus serpentipes]